MNGWRSMYWVLIPQHRIDVVHIPNETSPTEVESAGLEDRQHGSPPPQVSRGEPHDQQ